LTEDARQVRRRIADLEDKGLDYRRMAAESHDPDLKTFYQGEVREIASKIASLQEELSRSEHMIATPVRHNTTPRTPRTLG
jgi:protein subunit release factor A